MSWIEVLPSGRRRVLWREPGKRSPSKSESVATKAEALLLQSRIDAEQASRVKRRPGQVLGLASLIHAWCRAKIGEGNHKGHTERARDRLLTFCERWGFAEVDDVTADAIDAIKAGERKQIEPHRLPGELKRRAVPWSPRAGAFLRGVLTWAMDRQGIDVPRSTLVALRPRNRPRQRRDLVEDATVAEWLRLSHEIGPSAFALVHCLLLYGWRPITAARFLVRDLRAGQGIIVAEIKSRVGTREHVHALLPETVRLLEGIAKGRPLAAPLFLDPRTDAAFAETGSRAIPQWWRDYLPGRSYDCKRFAATRILRVVRATEGKAITGHLVAGSLELYGVSNIERQREILQQVGPLPRAGTHGCTVGAKQGPDGQEAGNG